MKKALLVLSISFALLCFLGAGYVLYTHGRANGGYAVVPMLLGMICLQGYAALKKRDEEK